MGIFKRNTALLGYCFSESAIFGFENPALFSHNPAYFSKKRIGLYFKSTQK
jgi:hypothetical protein